MKPINLKTLLEAANNNYFLDHRIRVVELYLALKSKINEGKSIRISTTRKTHIISQETYSPGSLLNVLAVSSF